MASLVYRPARGARSAYDLSDFIGSLLVPVTPEGRTGDSVIGGSKPGRYRLLLGKDPILAIPWSESSLTNAMANNGHGRCMGQWRADFNHKVNLVLPFGLGLVHGGNHSLAAGVVNAEGTVVTSDVIDLSPLYEHVRYDGASMIRTHDGRRLWEPVEEEFGILFEIGRLMLEHGVRYDAPVATDDEDGGDGENESFPICYRVYFDGQDTGFAFRQWCHAGAVAGGHRDWR
jgi:hypothetical protein